MGGGGGGEGGLRINGKNSGAVQTSLQLAFTDSVVPATQAFDNICYFVLTMGLV